MSVTLSKGDIERLRESLRLLLRPGDFPDASAWRLAVCRYLLSWIDTDAVHFTIARGQSTSMIGAGRWGEATVREYVENWHERQEVDDRRARDGVHVWVRDMVVPRAEFRRTSYFRDFCAPHRLLDSAGANHRFPDGQQVVLHLNASRTDTFPTGGRTHAILELLHPALLAGVEALQMVAAAGPALASVDALPTEAAILSFDGIVLHATPSLLARHRDRQLMTILPEAMRQLAADVAELWRGQSGDRHPRPTRQVDTGRERFTLSAAVLDQRSTTSTPLCLVTVTSEPAPVLDVRTRFGLTKREAQVCSLLARGCQNRQIAALLGVSEHTARRHTEKVLAKLGVGSRAAVAAVMTGSALLRADAIGPLRQRSAK